MKIIHKWGYEEIPPRDPSAFFGPDDEDDIDELDAMDEEDYEDEEI